MASPKQTSISSFFQKKTSPSIINKSQENQSNLYLSNSKYDIFQSPSKLKNINSNSNDDSEILEKNENKAPLTNLLFSEDEQEIASEQLNSIKAEDQTVNNESEELVRNKKLVLENSKFKKSRFLFDNSDNDSQASQNTLSEDEIEDESEKDEKSRVTINSPEGKNAIVKLMENAKLKPTENKKKNKKNKTSVNTSKINWFACELKENENADISSAQFDPSNYEIDKFKINKDNYDYILFEFLSSHFDKILTLKGSGSGSKKSTTVMLTNVFRCLIYYSPDELIPAILISLNKVAPNYMGIEIGIGEFLIMKSMAEIYGRTEASIKKEMSYVEDLGAIAEKCSCKMRTLIPLPKLSIFSTFNLLKNISESSGHNSQQKKKDILKRLLGSARGSESKYIIRFLLQTMRIGINTAIIYQSVAFAFALTRPNYNSINAIEDIRKNENWLINELDEYLIDFERAVKTSLCAVPSIEIVVGHLLKGADNKILPNLCVITPGIPIQPMLARPTKGINEVFERFSNSNFTCEFKYDGERAQLHMLNKGEYKIFSRRLEELTNKYPDILEILSSSINDDVNDFIIDSEVVAYDSEQNKILPFQILSTRKRKMIDSDKIKVNIMLFPFDCIRYNGISLLSLSLRERRNYLYKALNQVSGKISFATNKEMNTIEDVDTFLQEAIDNSCEGLMVKTLDENASYEPFKRSLNWLKVKKDYIEGMTDSIDLIPVGAYYGRGKRSCLFGTYLLASYNDVDETFQSICKIATGFSEEDLQNHYAYYKERILTKKSPLYDISDKLEPDVWLEASQVWECRAADLSISPVHTAAKDLKVPEKGIGLRFPRFIKLREDKSIQDATNSIQILEMYNSQFDTKKTQSSQQEPDSDSDNFDF